MPITHTKRTIEWPGGYTIELALSTESTFTVMCHGPYDWGYVPMYRGDMVWWPLKKADYVMALVREEIAQHRRAIAQLEQKSIPGFQAVCDFSQALGELEADNVPDLEVRNRS